MIGSRARWAAAIAVVLWLAPSTVSTGRIPGDVAHVDAALFEHAGTDEAPLMHVIDDRVAAQVE